jgi:hypothetical protein
MEDVTYEFELNSREVNLITTAISFLAGRLDSIGKESGTTAVMSQYVSELGKLSERISDEAKDQRESSTTEE